MVGEARLAQPRVAVRSGFVTYRGPSADTTVHRHAAFQIAAASHGVITMFDASGGRHRSSALVVAPMTPHRLVAADVRCFYVDAHSEFAAGLRARYRAGITEAPELVDLHEDDVAPGSSRPARALHPRLLEALTLLADDDVAISCAAATVGLSPQRLGEVARRQLGLPLTRWRVWARLGRAVEALEAGLSLADAAATAGFTDQAHFSRWTREAIGVTPAAFAAAVRR